MNYIVAGAVLVVVIVVFILTTIHAFNHQNDWRDTRAEPWAEREPSDAGGDS